MKLVTLDEIKAAQERLVGVAMRTPLLPCPARPEHRHSYFKPENFQPVGAFKIRGAYNVIATLSDAERARGVIAFSSGNHAQGVAYAARALGVKAVIVMPENAPPVKRQGTEKLGAEIVTVGNSSEERRLKAEELAAQHGYYVVPPYNNHTLIAGQGTVGLEIFQDLPEVETVLVPVGGGGLLSGVATALKLSKPGVKVIGVEPELAGDASASFKAGKIVEFTSEQTSRTLADGLRTQRLGDITFPHIQEFVDDIITVTEDEIRAAMRSMLTRAHLVVEPSGAVAFAAYAYHRHQLPATEYNVAVVSGGNADPKLLAEILLS